MSFVYLRANKCEQRGLIWLRYFKPREGSTVKVMFNSQKKVYSFSGNKEREQIIKSKYESTKS